MRGAKYFDVPFGLVEAVCCDVPAALFFIPQTYSQVLCKARYVLCWSLLVFPSPEHCFGIHFSIWQTSNSPQTQFQEASKLGWPTLWSPCISHISHLIAQTIKDEKLVTVTGATELRVTITCKEPPQLFDLALPASPGISRHLPASPSTRFCVPCNKNQ